MALPFEISVALRYIRSRKKGPVSLITLITIGGVAVGVTALTVVTSVWNGFESEFLEKLLGINAHAVVLKRGDVFRDYEDVAAKVRKQPGITFVAPFVYSEVIAQSPAGVQGVAIKGIDPKLASETPLSRFLDQAAFSRLESERPPPGTVPDSKEPIVPRIFIGKELKEALHVKMGDVITIVSPYGGSNGQPRTQPFEITGIFHSGMFEFDSRMVFVDLREAQRFFQLYKTVTGLEVWSVDPMRSEAIISSAMQAVDPVPMNYDVRDWRRTNRGVFGAVRSQKILISMVLGFIVLVAAFNIVSTLILLILEKSREIAVLKSLGASNRSILTIFVLDGQIVGFTGCVLGVVGGLVICAVLEQYGLKLDPRVYYLENLPIVVRPIEVFAVAIGAMLAATVATLFPAYKAATMPPVHGLTQLTGSRQRQPDPTP